MLHACWHDVPDCAQGSLGQSNQSVSRSDQLSQPSHACRHTAFQLLKLETVLNVATLGYSALWVEPHALIAGRLLVLIPRKLRGPIMK